MPKTQNPTLRPHNWKRTFMLLAAGVCLMRGAGLHDAQADSAKSAKKGDTTPMTTDKNPVLKVETNLGEFDLELWPSKAPKTVANFLKYVDEKHYDGTIFHRVIKKFMIQGGGFTESMTEKSTHEPIKNEANADVPNNRGTVAMARTGVVDSATAQFFVNTKDNDFLNHHDETPRGFGYAVFGKVISGMDVVDKIEASATGSKKGMDDVPLTPVVIKSIRRK